MTDTTTKASLLEFRKCDPKARIPHQLPLVGEAGGGAACLDCGTPASPAVLARLRGDGGDPQAAAARARLAHAAQRAFESAIAAALPQPTKRFAGGPHVHQVAVDRDGKIYCSACKTAGPRGLEALDPLPPPKTLARPWSTAGVNAPPTGVQSITRLGAIDERMAPPRAPAPLAPSGTRPPASAPRPLVDAGAMFRDRQASFAGLTDQENPT